MISTLILNLSKGLIWFFSIHENIYKGG